MFVYEQCSGHILSELHHPAFPDSTLHPAGYSVSRPLDLIYSVSHWFYCAHDVNFERYPCKHFRHWPTSCPNAELFFSAVFVQKPTPRQVSALLGSCRVPSYTVPPKALSLGVLSEHCHRWLPGPRCRMAPDCSQICHFCSHAFPSHCGRRDSQRWKLRHADDWQPLWYSRLFSSGKRCRFDNHSFALSVDGCAIYSTAAYLVYGCPVKIHPWLLRLPDRFFSYHFFDGQGHVLGPAVVRCTIRTPPGI